MQPIPVMESTIESTAGVQSFIIRVYMWMSAGLFITAIVSAAPFFILGPEKYMYFLAQNIYIFYGLLIFEFIIVFGMTAMLHKMPAIVGALAFLFYSFLNGLTISPIFIIYTGQSIFSTFFVCAGMFAGASVLGMVLKIDLSRFGGFLTLALIGLFGTMVVNFFLHSSTMSWIISFAGVIIFVGLAVYDTQKIKNMGAVDTSSQEGQKASIMGALALYLDFINLFLFLLRILGKRR